jgi:hypothetical protein
MSGLVVAQIHINDSSDKTITGVIQYDRNCGGSLSIPSGNSFPSGTTYPGEIFWRSDENRLYRRDDANTTWDSLNASSITIPGSTSGAILYYNGSTWTSLAAGLDGYFLQTHGIGNAPSWTDHDSIRRLVHLADGGGPFEGFASGTYREILPGSNPFPTSIIWWTSPVKTQKIVEKLITYNSNKTPATIQWKSYDTDGSTVLITITDTIVYSGVIEISRTRTIS